MTRLGVLALAGLLWTTAAEAQVFHPQTETLANGLQVVVLPNHRAPVVTQMIWYKAGAMDDPWGHSGVAHFLEHLSFKGTEKYPNDAYSKIISQMGGTENAFTSYDYTAYYATFGKQYLEKLMDLESDRMNHWQATEAQVATERQVILKERDQRTENDPVAHFFEDVNAVLYNDYPYQRPVIGWKKEMQTLSRDDALDFVHAHYAPNNAILVLSGDVELAEIKPLLDKYYAPIPSRAVVKRPDVTPPAITSAVTITNASPLVKETIWSRHTLLAPARPATIVRSDAQMVLQKIMGDDRVGRLYRRLVVRDKIATSASISFNATGIGPQRFAIVATPAPGIGNDKIAAAIDDEIAGMLKNGVTETEVKNATRGLETAAVYARDSVTGPAMTVGAALASDLDLATVEAWPQRMRSVTKAAVDQAAREIFAPDKPWVTAILTPEAAK